MVLNDKVSMSAANRKADEVDQDLKLENQKIKRVSSMKYLGVIITSNGKINDHFQSRINKAYAAIAILNSTGLFSNNMHPNTRAQMFKTYIRPVLYYGLDCNELNITQKNDLIKFEGNVVKRSLYIPTRCHTTGIFQALKISTSSDYLKYIKNSLILRLVKNEFTKELLDISIRSDMGNDLISEIIELNDMEEGDLDLKSLTTACENKISEYKTKKKNLAKNLNDEDMKIKEVLQLNGKFLAWDLFNLTKF